MHKLVIAAALVAACSTHAALAANVEALDNATIQPNGPRSGGNGLAFFNIEGGDNGNFASYGLARFDLGALKANFDATYGMGGWVLDSVSLQLTQSNASFTADGGVNVYFTGVDNNSPLQGSGLQYGNFASDFADASLILGYTFTEVGSGTLETYSLYSAGGANSAGGQALAADIMGGDIVTLALVETTSGVAATYAGYTNSSYEGPTLEVNVSAVPEPETWALLLAGLALVGGVARRQA